MSKKQVILLMITNRKKSHYLVVTNLSPLLQGMPSNHDGDFHCLNCFNSYTTENLTQRKRLYMSLLLGQCLQAVRLMKRKINLIITEKMIEKILLKNYVKS